MKTKNNWGRIVAVVIFLVYTLSLVSSVNVGISPGMVEFNDVVREGYAERYIAISADSVDPVRVSLIPRGEIEEWISYPVEEFEVSKGNPYYLKLSITPPANTPNGNYSGFLKFLTESNADEEENHSVGKIRSSLDLSIKTTVTDIEYVECSVSDIKIKSSEKGDDVILSMNVLNLGNIRLNPSLIIDIWDRDQISILKTEDFSGKSILPTIKETLTFKISSNDLEIGQYWGDLSVLECLSSSLLTFDILSFENAFKLSILTLTNTVTSSIYGLENLIFFDLNNFTKISLIIFMILGKIEIIAVLYLIKRFFFRE